MNKRNCKKEGHNLEEVKAVVGYRCKDCEHYIRDDCISRYGYGTCPKCDAPESKLESHLWGSEHIGYKCKNCGHSWVELM